MARLKVMLRGAMINEIVLQNEREYIGGRKDGSDIRLQAEKGISREHFKLKFAEGHWTIQAVSRFGDIFSMGQKIEQATLDHGQSFQIPPYEFQLLEIPDSDFAASSSDQINQVSESEKTVIGVAPQVPYIKVINSNGEVREMLRLEVGEVWVAGRDPSCQIIIPDQRVSRRQFEIHKLNGNYTVIDLASVNGTFLNGSPVSSTDPQSLKSGDAITVLDNTMYFELHDPNFKYKIEKIEVPPLVLEQPEEKLEEPFSDPALAGVSPELPPQNYPMDIPQIQQDQINPQLNTGGGPFTGVPPNFNPNQYYTFVPPQQQPPVKKKSNSLMLIIILLVAAGGGYYYYDLMKPTPETQNASKPVDPNDPLSKLKPEQQTQIRELYSLADQMLTQQKYELAIEKLTRLHEILKEGYLDSKEMELRANSALASAMQSHLDDEARRTQEENLKKVAEVSEKCEKLLGPMITAEAMQVCLTPILQFDANSPDVVRLMAEAEKIQKEREQRETQAKNLQAQVLELVDIFNKAEAIQNEGYAFKAIDQYKEVLKSDLPDPNRLKEKSKSRIEFIKSKVAEKTAKSVTAAEAFLREGKLKDAVHALRESLVYDPQNPKVKEKIESYREELRRQARILYQESIIDESYGLVESTETKQGAREKWKKIVELDVDDGEYYRKAVTKLRRYGVL